MQLVENANAFAVTGKTSPPRTLGAIFDLIDEKRRLARHHQTTLCDAAAAAPVSYSYIRNRRRAVGGDLLQRLIAGAFALEIISAAERDALAADVERLSGVAPVPADDPLPAPDARSAELPAGYGDGA